MRPADRAARAPVSARAPVDETPAAVRADAVGSPVFARAQMRPVGEGTARGTIEFRGGEGTPLAVNVMMLGLVAGAHAVHVHEGVDCAAADEHAAPGPASAPPDGRDSELGNVTAEASGLVHQTLRDTRLPFDRGLIGRMIVVHAGPEDLIARPGGGAAIACGVIEIAGGRASPAARPPRRLNA